ncbi:MAG: glycosyltransferase [Candidatus Competibacteraceae bacterium]
MSNRKLLRLSVAICTFNRAASLARTLKSFAQTRPIALSDWELLVIDNNSTDATRLVVEQFAGILPLHYHFESQQGLANARNRAIAEYCGELLVFTDDDILIGENWLKAYYGALACYPSAGYFGGPIMPCFSAGRPSWLRDETMPLISGLIGHYDLGSESRWYSAVDMHPFGANFALRRKLVDSLGFFETELGVRGEVPGRSEEAEYFSRATKQGFSGYYLAEARCQHCVQPSHLRLGFLYRYGVQKGLAAGRMGKLHPRRQKHEARNLAMGAASGNCLKGVPTDGDKVLSMLNTSRTGKGQFVGSPRRSNGKCPVMSSL